MTLAQKILLFFSIAFLFLPQISNAQNNQGGSFVLDVFYQNGNLFAGDTKGLIASASMFVSPTRPYPLYTAQLFDKTNKLLKESKIDQRGGVANLKEGLIRIALPFNKNTAKIIIQNESGAQKLEWFVENFEFCSYNKACEDFLGETKINCPEDCAPKQGVARLSPTPPIKQASSSSGNSWVAGIWVFSGVILLAGLAMIYIAKRRQSQG